MLLRMIQGRYLIDFTSWKATRVDYTVDVRMRNQDEVLAFMNLAKWSVISTSRNKSKYASSYGKGFRENTCKFGNKSWEIQIYDKAGQFAKKKDEFEDNEELFHSLQDECQNLVRIEYRRLTNGTKKSSTTFESKFIMEFLDEEIAQRWLISCYESTVGFEDFYRAYHAEKMLDKAFPMNASEIRNEKKREKAAIKAGEVYKAEKHSKRFYKYRDHMMNIMNHKGMDNALKAALSGLSGKARESARDKFMRWNKKIREKAGISPVMIPDAWKTKRKLDIPNRFLRNPVQRPS